MMPKGSEIVYIVKIFYAFIELKGIPKNNTAFLKYRENNSKKECSHTGIVKYFFLNARLQKKNADAIIGNRYEDCLPALTT